MIGVSRSYKLPFPFNGNTMLSHQAGHTVLTTGYTLILEFVVHSWTSVSPSALLVYIFNLLH